MLALWVALFFCFHITTSQQLQAQFGSRVKVYPTILYPGMNLITISTPDGIRSIQRNKPNRFGGSWATLLTGYDTEDFRIITGPIFSSCATQAQFTIYVKTITRDIRLDLNIIDCDNASTPITMGLGETWNVYREDFGTVMEGENVCATFSVETIGKSYVVDSIISPLRAFTIRYTRRQPPIVLRSRDRYMYQVCFSAQRPGIVKAPIYVYLRRHQPAGKYTTFIVADTAYVTVLRAQRSAPPVAFAPPKVVIRPKPKPKPIPRSSAVGLATQAFVADAPLAQQPDMPRQEILTQSLPEFFSDPTPFRAILTPTARSLGEGNAFVANYDAAGWVVGYGVSERITALAGFLYVPDFISQTLVVTGGVKYEFLRTGSFRTATGVQTSYSVDDSTHILLGAPYAAATLGDDDKQVTLTVGYSLRRHTPESSAPFTRQALLLGIGGDYRIGDNWKVVGEGFLLQEADYRPLAVTLRYFTDAFAIDGGVAINTSGSSALPVAPVISGMIVW